MTKPVKLLLAVWATFTILAGSVLTSFHQPFLAPTSAILQLAEPATRNQLRALHILGAGCGCSQRVMRHLIERKLLPATNEQVILIDGPAPELPGTAELIASLTRLGFAVRRMSTAALPPAAALRGVPLLVFATPDGSVLYMGGYGPAYDQDSVLFQQIQQKQSLRPLAQIGCAVSESIRRKVDPLHLKN